jgi:hypothetical protein
LEATTFGGYRFGGSCFRSNNYLPNTNSSQTSPTNLTPLPYTNRRTNNSFTSRRIAEWQITRRSTSRRMAEWQTTRRSPNYVSRYMRDSFTARGGGYNGHGGSGEESRNNITSYIARCRVTIPGTLSLIGFIPTWFSMRFLMRPRLYTPVGDY